MKAMLFNDTNEWTNESEEVYVCVCLIAEFNLEFHWNTQPVFIWISFLFGLFGMNLIIITFILCSPTFRLFVIVVVHVAFGSNHISIVLIMTLMFRYFYSHIFIIFKFSFVCTANRPARMPSMYAEEDGLDDFGRCADVRCTRTMSGQSTSHFISEGFVQYSQPSFNGMVELYQSSASINMCS